MIPKAATTTMKKRRKNITVRSRRTGFEILTVHVDPGLRALRRREKLLRSPAFTRSAPYGSIGLYRDAMERVAEAVEFLPDVNRHEQELGVVQVMAGLENAGHGQFFRARQLRAMPSIAFLFARLFGSRASLCRRGSRPRFPGE